MIRPTAGARVRIPQRRTGHPFITFRAFVLAIAGWFITGGLGGCQSKAGEQSGPRVDAERFHNAEERLIGLSHAELRKGDLDPLDVPPPPGVDARSLQLREADDLKAWVSLEEAIEVLNWKTAEEPPEFAEMTAEVQAEALRRYVRGREAAADGRYLQAITDLREAHRIDPSSPEILRALARSYLEMPEQNVVAATSYFADLLRLEPGDSEAALHVASAAANRRDFESSAATIGRVMLTGGSFDHDPAGSLLAHYTLFVSLQHLGYDRAAIDAGTHVVNSPAISPHETLHAARVGWLTRQRGELWRDIGDAHCRLGESARALSAYESAGSLPLADRDALVARMVYAHLRQGRPFTAQRDVLAALQNLGATDRIVGLCGYLAEHAKPVDALARAVEAMMATQPDDEAFVRAAASVLPTQQAVSLLRAYVQAHPDQDQAQTKLLRWLAHRDDHAAFAFAIALAESDSTNLRDLADQLASTVSSIHGLLAHAQSQRPNAFEMAIEAQLRLKLEDFGRAWALADRAIADSPDEPALHCIAIDIAAAMREPALLRSAVQRAGHLADPSIGVAASAAFRSLGLHQDAIDAAEQALQIAPDDPNALVALASAIVETAGTMTDSNQRSAMAAEAIALTERAISLSSLHEDAYHILLVLYDKDGLVSDETLYRQTRRSLAAADRAGRLNRALQARDELVFRRYEQALEQALAIHEAFPSDSLALDIAIEAWRGQERLDAAMGWIEDRLDQRPGDPILLDRWLTLHSHQETVEQALPPLRRLVAEAPEHLLAMRLLELACRVTGRVDEATSLGEQRLLQRPQGIRRELELADIYSRGGRIDDAVDRLQWVRSHADEALRDQLLAALASAHRLSEKGPLRDELILELAETCLQKFPDMPLQIYGVAMESMSRLDRIDESFDGLVQRAIRSAPMADEIDSNGAGHWILIAQSLIDTDAPLAAARALRIRLESEPQLEPFPFGQVARACAAANAKARQVEDSIEFIRALADQGHLEMFWPFTDEPPSLAECLLAVATIHNEVGDADGADALMEMALGLEPDNGMAMNDIGYTRIERGRHDPQTIRYIERAYEINAHNPNVQDTIGWLRYKQGRIEDDEQGPGAVSLISQATQRNAPEPEVLDHLADAYWRVGQRENATLLWQKIIGILDEPRIRQSVTNELQSLQSRIWSVIVYDPANRYDRMYGSVLERARRKYEAATRDEPPPVAPTFQELESDRESE